MWRLILILLILTLLAGLLLLQFAPAKDFLVWLPTFPLFFIGFGYVSTILLKKIEKMGSQKHLIGFYMGVHVFKMICIALLTAFYILLLEVNVWQFLLTLLVFYILHLIWETRLFFTYEHTIKKRTLL